MARSVPYRRENTDACSWHQDEALNSTIYILYNTGPTGFLLKEEGEPKNFKVFLGDVHNCTCPVFKKEKDLCKHISWLLLKKFRIPRTNPLTWQLGLCEREINEVLRGVIDKENESRKVRIKKRNENSETEQGTIQQREINEEDVCPICQDSFLTKRQPVTYCKFGCGNNVHIKCMKVWADHQKSNGETTLKCPLCRENFSSFDTLEQEFRNNGLFKTEKQTLHHGLICSSCNASPISGKCYKCSVCQNLFLCQACFNTEYHNEHSFLYKEKENSKFQKAVRDFTGSLLPKTVVNSLLTREISENDYDLLLQLDRQAAASNANGNQSNVFSKIPEKVIKSWPSERLGEKNKLLSPGYQCRVCLKVFKVGQLVRKLPRCNHKFHVECIDNWLLHSHPTCPIDGLVVWDPHSEEEARQNNLKREEEKKKALKNTMEGFDLNQLGLIINYKNVNQEQISSNNKSEMVPQANRLLDRRNLKPNIQRQQSSSLSNNILGTLEVTGQHLSSNHRNTSSLSDGCFDGHRQSNLNIRNVKPILPKINHKNTQNTRKESEQGLNNDPFSVSLMISKPYQLSRVGKNNQNMDSQLNNRMSSFNSESNYSGEIYDTNQIEDIENDLHDLQEYSRDLDCFLSTVPMQQHHLYLQETIAQEKPLIKKPPLRVHHPIRRKMTVKPSNIKVEGSKPTNKEINASKLDFEPIVTKLNENLNDNVEAVQSEPQDHHIYQSKLQPILFRPKKLEEFEAYFNEIDDV